MIDSESIEAMAADHALRARADALFVDLCNYRYSYHFDWMGRPIVQFPQDVFAMQELIWQVQPDLIIETGIAHGGSLVFSA
ncbi:MAG: cephalosporin hydroxylase, partial [Planctomycetes bacterium]|nr:cephalosporin hydroxylase [Planctomycetota bacterium]